MHIKTIPGALFRKHGILLGALCLTVGCASAAEEAPTATTSSALAAPTTDGAALFDDATFRGNGRTCATCHSEANHGTLSPMQVQALAKTDPRNPIFNPIDSDDGVGSSYSRLKRNATIRVHMPLPANIRLLDDPGAKEVVLNRGVPTTNNTPALNAAALMSDGREPDLISQALGAVNAHFQPRVQPTNSELNLIAGYEKTLFSSEKLRAFSNGGSLGLPVATTPAEVRGAAFFKPHTGFCAACHATNLMDRTPTGDQFTFLMTGELDGETQNNALRMYVVGNQDGSPCDPRQCASLALPAGGGVCVTAPINGCTQPFRDPGRMLATGDIFDGGVYKIPILWGVNDTAPYFHDNSAADLHQVMDHYRRFVGAFGPIPGTKTPTLQDDDDIIAFMRLF